MRRETISGGARRVAILKIWDKARHWKGEGCVVFLLVKVENRLFSDSLVLLEKVKK